MFAELLAHEGVEELCEAPVAFGLMGVHGATRNRELTRSDSRRDRAGASLYASCNLRGCGGTPIDRDTTGRVERLAAFSTMSMSRSPFTGTAPR